MISYSQQKKSVGLNWESYLHSPGYSFSFLKSEQNGVSPHIEETDNMRLGTMVDNILTSPAKVNMASDIYPIARDIASKISGQFGNMIARFEKQVSFTATAIYQDFYMPVRGRLDFLLPEIAVIDLKITKAKDPRAIISLLKYEDQVWHYAKMARVPKAYLMMYSVPLKKTFIFPVDVSSNSNHFMSEKILKFGTYANAKN